MNHTKIEGIKFGSTGYIKGIIPFISLEIMGNNDPNRTGAIFWRLY
jgi:hypothetical protein